MIHTRYAVVFVWIVLYGIFGFDKVYAQIDTMAYSLDTVSVTAKRHTSYIRGNMNESIRWNMDMLHDLPKILGNADPIHYTQLLPGVQTCSEYNSGLYIQGCDNAHNLVSIEGVPIYNASHLLGFFSIFKDAILENLSKFICIQSFGRSIKHGFTRYFGKKSFG